MVKISVIVPTYKPGVYIDKAIKSLFNQSLDPRLFEIIIVLNGPKDPFWDGLQKYAEEINNLKLYYNEISGVSNARNFGIDKSKGEYVCFLDDDDWVSVNYLQGMLSLQETISDKNLIVQSNWFAIKDGERRSDYIREAYALLKDQRYSLFRYRKFLSSVAGKLISKKIIDTIRFRSDLEIAEDAVFMFELSKSIDEILLSDENCVYYRELRDGSVLRRKRNLTEILSNYFKKIKAYFQVYSSSAKEYDFFLFISRLVASSKMLVNDLVSSK